jgi:hippurate hydrolase
MKSLASTIAEVHEDLVTLRQHIHQNPEPGFEEVKTQARLKEELEGLGLKPINCAKTGLYLDLGQGQGKAIALRADIDCLRMTEGNPNLSYRSQNDGCAHMCGHDGHTAVLMGVARVLSSIQNKIPGAVRLFFQPAEEGPGGAPLMIEEGVLDGIDEVYGMHNWPNVPLGELRTISGPCMATVTTLRMTVHGRGGHGSQPHDTIDPVLTAAHIIIALQSIVSRNMHSKEQVVVTVTTVHGGEVENVIPDSVALTGTVRALDDKLMDAVCERIEAIASNTANAFGASVDVDLQRNYPVVVNHEECTENVMRIGARVLGKDQVSSHDLPILGAEDFAYYLQHKPGCFFFLGGSEEGRSNSFCHSTDYDFNDNLISPAVQFWIRLIEDRLDLKLFED